MTDADAENLCYRLIGTKGDAHNLFTLLNVKGMPPTNNHAEQALRLPVIFCKISFGGLSLHGAQAMAINLSLLTTAKRQNKNPIDLFKSLLLHGSNLPLEVLYDLRNIPTLDSS